MTIKRIRNYINGNTTKSWRTLVVIIFTLLIGLGGWGLSEIYSFSSIYVSKDDYIRETSKIEKQIEKQTSEMRNGFSEIRKSMDDLKNFLLEDYSRRRDGRSEIHN